MLNGPYFVLPGPEGFKGHLLDHFLAAGYYRMQHTVFTTHHTRMHTGGAELPVFWLRTQVNDITESSTAVANRKKCARFTVTYHPAAITDETEALYSQYLDAIDFNTSATCFDCLHDERLENPFDTRMIEIRDGNLLVAAGYFDVGHQAISGILNFYHPAYKKYSLGKYLILKKIDWARANAIPLYYTGYISTAITKFDYKLFPAKTAIEVYLPAHQHWMPYHLLEKEWLQDYHRKHFV